MQTITSQAIAAQQRERRGQLQPMTLAEALL